MVKEGDARGNETGGLIHFYNLSLNTYSKLVSEMEILEYLDLGCGTALAFLYLKGITFPQLLSIPISSWDNFSATCH